MSREAPYRYTCVCAVVIITVAGVLGYLSRGTSPQQPGTPAFARMLLMHRRPRLKSAASMSSGPTQGAVTGASSRRVPGVPPDSKQLGLPAAGANDPKTTKAQEQTQRQKPDEFDWSFTCERCVTLVLPTHFGDLSRALVTLSSLTINFPAAYAREVVLVVPYEEARVLNNLLLFNPGALDDTAALDDSTTTPGSCNTSTGSCSSNGSSSSSSSSGGGGGDSATGDISGSSAGSTSSAASDVGTSASSSEVTESYRRRLPVRVLSEEEVLQVPLDFIFNATEPISLKRTGKYRLQMALKLWIAQHINTDWYMTLDSDLVMNRPLEDINWLLPGGKARYHQVPRKAHTGWWEATSALLDNTTCLGPDFNAPREGFGVTPALLARNISLEVIKTLHSLYGNSTLQVMFDLTKPMWTEYTLYRTVGCMTNTFFDYHTSLNTLRGVPMPYLYGGMWGRGKLDSIPNGCASKTGCLFCVVQSTTKIQLRSVVRMFPRVWDVPQTQGGVHSETAEPLDPADPESIKAQHTEYFSQGADSKEGGAAAAAGQGQPSPS